jgi:ribosome-associated protein
MTAPSDASDDDTIPLEGFLKREGLTETGGQAKLAIQSGSVTVNGVVETRRKKKLRRGDIVGIHGKSFTVADID